MANFGWSVWFICAAGLLIAHVRAQTTVDCNFDSGTFCNWENVQTDQFDWQLGSSVAVDGFHSIPRTLTGTGSFAYAQGQFQTTLNANNEALLQSPQISSLTSPATFTFSYWKTAIPPTLDICTQEDGGSLQCVDTISGAGPFEWSQRQVTIPANPLAFRIVFRARNFNSALDIIGLDDVQFRLAARDIAKSDAPSDPFRASVNGQPSLRNVLPVKIGLQPLAPSTVPPLRVFEPLFSTDPVTTNARTLPPFTTPTFTVPPLDNSNEVADASALASPFSSSRLAVNRATESFVSSNGVQDSIRPGSLGFVTGPNEPIPGGCKAVQCTFTRDMCSWGNVFDANYDWKQTSGQTQSRSSPAQTNQTTAHIFVGGEGRNAQQRAGIRSAEFVVPAGAFVEFGAYISDPLIGRLAVYQNNKEDVQDPIHSGNLIWDRTGFDSIGGGGWRRLRVPVRASSYPITLLFVADGLSLPQHIIGLDDVKLVNSLGEEIGCGSDVDDFQSGSSKAVNVDDFRSSARQAVTVDDFRSSARQVVNPEDIIPKRLTAFQQLSANTPLTPRYETFAEERFDVQQQQQQNSLRGINDVNFGGFPAPPVAERFTETPVPSNPIDSQPDYPTDGNNNAEWLPRDGGDSTVIRPLSSAAATLPIEGEDPFAGRSFRTITSNPVEHTNWSPDTTLPELPTTNNRQQITTEDRQEILLATLTPVQDPFQTVLQPIRPINAPEQHQSLLLPGLQIKPSISSRNIRVTDVQPPSLSAIVPIVGGAFAPIERVVEQQTARDSVVQPAPEREHKAAEVEPPRPQEGFLPAIVPVQPVQPIKATVNQPEPDPQTQQVLNRLTKDIERLFGIPISQSVGGFDHGDALYSQATHLSAGERPLTKENLDFILQNALTGRKRK